LALRRIFLLGAASIVSLAALVAIATVLTGDFGDTEGKIFATLATAFVAVSTAAAGLALLERGVARPLGVAGVVLAAGGFLLWSEQIWAGHDSEGYWKLLLLVLTWTLAVLVVTTARLMTRSERLLRTLFRMTAVATVGAALTASTGLLREQGDGWQLFAVLLIVAVVGQILTPILERYAGELPAGGASQERVLGAVAGAVVVAVRTGRGRRSVRVGERDIPIADDETVLVRTA